MKKIIFSLIGFALVFGLATTAMADTKTIVSDTSVNVYGPLDHYAAIDSSDWGVSKSAVITWKHPSWPTIADATWISSAYDTEDPRPDSWRLFSGVIDLPLSAINITGSISVTSDNAEEVYLNGILVGSDGEVQGTAVDNQEWNTILNHSLTGLHAGINELDIIVRNYAYNTDSPTVNPAGLIYKAEITYEIGDIIAPVITFVEPATGLTHSGTIHLKATCNETCNYVNFWWRAEGEGYGDFRYHYVHTNGIVSEWDLNTLSALKADSSTYIMADGVYYLYAAGKDLAGNWARTPEIMITVDNIPDLIDPPTDKDQCKKGGWKIFNNPSFKNQGQCVSYVQANEKAGKR